MTAFALLALAAPTHGGQAVLYLLAFVAFVAAAIVAWPAKYATLEAIGLALFVAVLAWVQLAAT